MKQSVVGFFAAVLCAARLVGAADPEVRFRSETRVVMVDVMVEDVKTRMPVSDLSVEDFRLRIEGKDRRVTYFGREGSERRPLAMLVYLNLAPEGGLRELVRPQAVVSFSAALSRLAGEDEVAVYATNQWFVGAPKEMTGLTRDREAAAQGMRAGIESAFATTEEERKAEGRKREGSMAAAIEKAREIAKLRPGSQVALVYVSDGMNTLDTMESRGRRTLAEKLQEANITFSALDLRMMGSYAAAAAVLNPLGMAFGISVTGSSDYLAKQTGGVALEVPDAGVLGAGLDRVLSSYMTRYSLGYQLTDGEYGKGGRHRIQVDLMGGAAKNKNVIYRKGFAVLSPM